MARRTGHQDPNEVDYVLGFDEFNQWDRGPLEVMRYTPSAIPNGLDGCFPLPRDIYNGETACAGFSVDAMTLWYLLVWAHAQGIRGLLYWTGDRDAASGSPEPLPEGRGADEVLEFLRGLP